jgi:hypothetical protein
VCWALTTTHVKAVHMEALNHCFLRRSDLRERLEQENLLGQVEIPEDGATVAGSARSRSERRPFMSVDANQRNETVMQEKRCTEHGGEMVRGVQGRSPHLRQHAVAGRGCHEFGVAKRH